MIEILFYIILNDNQKNIEKHLDVATEHGEYDKQIRIKIAYLS